MNAEPGPTPGLVRLGDDRFSVDVATDPERWLAHFGPRFDTSLAVASVCLDGLEFCGRWGLVDEFGLRGLGVLGYDEAAPGAPFLKVGVGLLARIDDAPYWFAAPYPAVEFARTEQVVEDEAVRAVQVAELGASFGYRLQKRVGVDPRVAGLVIDYELTNLGTRALDVEQYNHNWLLPGGRPPASGYSVQPGFDVALAAPHLRTEGGVIHLLPMSGRAPACGADVAVPAARHRVSLRHVSGATVEIAGGRPVSRFALYVDADGVCPELFVRWNVPSGETVRWRREYRFRTGA